MAINHTFALGSQYVTKHLVAKLHYLHVWLFLLLNDLEILLSSVNESRMKFRLFLKVFNFQQDTMDNMSENHPQLNIFVGFIS